MRDTVDAYFGAQDTESRKAYVTGDNRTMTIYSLVMSSQLKNHFKSICVRNGLSPAAVVRDLLIDFVSKYREDVKTNEG